MEWLWILVGYFVGSIPFGLLAGKLKGIDIRDHGSGNIGATNALRTLGKRVGITVFILDTLKGIVPVWLAKHFAGDVEPVLVIPVLTIISTILGHNFPVWLKFKGGKGIATSGGALIPLIPWTFLIALVLWALAFFLTRYVSVASIVAAFTLPACQIVFGLIENDWESRYLLVIVTSLMCAMAIYRHKSNIRKLLNGTESRFERKKKSTAETAPPAA